MARVAHDRQALAAFQDGETRFVYARHRAEPDRPLFYLPDGQAVSFRAWAKEALECFMPDCTGRTLTTVSRSKGRDGFTHLAGAGGHSQEGAFHQQAKALLVGWARARYPQVRVEAEEATASGARRADVMLTWPSGEQVALEVQYAPLTPAAWLARHESYRQQGVRAVWLLGHHGCHLPAQKPRSWETPEQAAGRARLTALQQAMLEAGETLLWINPIEQQIGTVWVERSAHECVTRWCDYDEQDSDLFDVRPGPEDEEVLFGVDPLDGCEVGPDGLRSPLLSALLAGEAGLRTGQEVDARRNEAALRKQEEQEALAEARRDKEALDRARREATFEKRKAFAEARAAERQERWLASEMHAQVVRYYGAVPTVLAEELPYSNGVFAAPAHWHCLIYRRFLLQRVGQHFDVKGIYALFREEGIELHADPKVRGSAIRVFLERLAMYGLVALDVDPGAPWRITQVTVTAEIETPSEAAARKAQEAAAKAEYERLRAERVAARIEREQRAAALRQSIADRQPQANPSSAPPRQDVRPERSVTASPARLVCRRCGDPLDPVLAETGLHVLC